MKNECREYAEMIRNDVNSLYEGEAVDECESLLDYIANALDVEYTLNSCRELIGVRVYVTLGGRLAGSTQETVKSFALGEPARKACGLRRKCARRLTLILRIF